MVENKMLVDKMPVLQADNLLEFEILKRLEEGGYEAYFVGGSVRDLLLDARVDDFDVVTSASVEEQEKILDDLAPLNYVGRNYGVLLVGDVEVAMYRSEEYVKDGTGKPEVETIKSVEKDSNRRDYTCNALYLDLDGNVLDFHNGIYDIENKILRAIGDPNLRFLEDASRILRGIYLSVKLGFTIDKHTAHVMTISKELMDKTAGELQYKIINKVIKNNKLADFLKLAGELSVNEKIFPTTSGLNNVYKLIGGMRTSMYELVCRRMQAVEMRYKKDNIHQLAVIFNNEWLLKRELDSQNYKEFKEFQRNLITEIRDYLRFLTVSKKDIKHIVDIISGQNELFFLFGTMEDAIQIKDTEVKEFLKVIVPSCKSGEELKAFIIDLFEYTELWMEETVLDFEVVNATAGKFDELVGAFKERLLQILDENYYYVGDLPIDGSDLLKNTQLSGKSLGDFLKAQCFQKKLTFDEYLQKAKDWQN